MQSQYRHKCCYYKMLRGALDKLRPKHSHKIDDVTGPQSCTGGPANQTAGSPGA